MNASTAAALAAGYATDEAKEDRIGAKIAKALGGVSDFADRDLIESAAEDVVKEVRPQDRAYLVRLWVINEMTSQLRKREHAAELRALRMRDRADARNRATPRERADAAWHRRNAEADEWEAANPGKQYDRDIPLHGAGYATDCECGPCDLVRQRIDRDRQEFARLIDNCVKDRAESMFAAWTDDLLGSTFALPDGSRATWGSATAEQHEARLAMLMATAAGTAETAALHKKALSAIAGAGVATLAEAVDA